MALAAAVSPAQRPGRQHYLRWVTPRTARHLAAAGFASDTYGSGQFVDFPATKASGVEPPQMLWEATFGRSIMSGLQKGGILDDLLDKCITPEQLTKAREIVAAKAADVPRIIIAMSPNAMMMRAFRRGPR